MRATGHIRSAIALATLLVAPSLLYAETIEFAPYHGRAMDIEREPIELAEDLELALDLDTEAMAIMNELDREEAFYEETSRRLHARIKRRKPGVECNETVATDSRAIAYRQQEDAGLRACNHHRWSDLRPGSLEPVGSTQGGRMDQADGIARHYRIERLYIEATAYATTELAHLTREESQTEAIRIALLEEHLEQRSADLRATNHGDGPALVAGESAKAINTSSASQFEINAFKEHATPHVANGDTGIRQTQAADGVVQTSYFSIRNGYVRRWERTQTNIPALDPKDPAVPSIIPAIATLLLAVERSQSTTNNSINQTHGSGVALTHVHAAVGMSST